MIKFKVVTLLTLARDFGQGATISHFLDCQFSLNAGWDNSFLGEDFNRELQNTIRHADKLVVECGGSGTFSSPSFSSSENRSKFEAVLAEFLQKDIHPLRGRIVERSEILGGSLSPNDITRLRGVLIKNDVSPSSPAISKPPHRSRRLK